MKTVIVTLLGTGQSLVSETVSKEGVVGLDVFISHQTCLASSVAHGMSTYSTHYKCDYGNSKEEQFLKLKVFLKLTLVL